MAKKTNAKSTEATMVSVESAEATMVSVEKVIADSVSMAEKGISSLKDAGLACRNWYHTKDKMIEDETWVRGAIAAGLPDDQRGALAYPKGSVPEDKKALRKTAQDNIAQYWKRLLNKYAFPEEKTEKTPRPVDERIREALDKIIATAEKAEDSKVDILKLLTWLNSARAMFKDGIDSII